MGQSQTLLEQISITAQYGLLIIVSPLFDKVIIWLQNWSQITKSWKMTFFDLSALKKRHLYTQYSSKISFDFLCSPTGPVPGLCGPLGESHSRASLCLHCFNPPSILYSSNAATGTKWHLILLLHLFFGVKFYVYIFVSFLPKTGSKCGEAANSVGERQWHFAVINLTLSSPGFWELYLFRCLKEFFCLCLSTFLHPWLLYFLCR